MSSKISFKFGKSFSIGNLHLYIVLSKQNTPVQDIGKLAKIFVQPSLDALCSSQNRLRSNWKRICDEGVYTECVQFNFSNAAKYFKLFPFLGDLCQQISPEAQWLPIVTTVLLTAATRR